MDPTSAWYLAQQVSQVDPSTVSAQAYSAQDQAAWAAYYAQYYAQYGYVYDPAQLQQAYEAQAAAATIAVQPALERKDIIEPCVYLDIDVSPSSLFVCSKVNSLYNMPEILAKNIITSDYYKKIKSVSFFLIHVISHPHVCPSIITDVDELIEEAKQNVNHVDPHVVGKQRMPSTAFCVIFHLCSLQLPKRTMARLLGDRSKPLMRALALLWLRIAAEPTNLWSWYERWLDDTQEFVPSGATRETMFVCFF